MLLISDDEDNAVRQEASRIREHIAVLTRNAARLEALSSSDRTSSFSSATAGAGSGDRDKQQRLTSRNHRNATTIQLPPSSLGRVDVFVATEFHGGAFERQNGNDDNCDADNDAGGACPASLSGCDASLGTTTCSGGTQGPISGRAEELVYAEGRGQSVRDVEVAERAWFSKRVLTAG